MPVMKHVRVCFSFFNRGEIKTLTWNAASPGCPPTLCRPLSERPGNDDFYFCKREYDRTSVNVVTSVCPVRAQAKTQNQRTVLTGARRHSSPRARAADAIHCKREGGFY